MRAWGSLLLAALVLAGTGLGCSGKRGRKGKEKIIRVGVGKLTEHHFQRKLAVQGTVSPVEFAVISSRTEGSVDALDVDEGSVVRKGDRLFQIDRRNLENQVSVNQHNLNVCKAELKNAQIILDFAKVYRHKMELDYRRSKTLRKSQAVSEENFESAELALKQADNSIAKAEASVELAKAKLEQQQSSLNIALKNLADSQICAPFAGVITDRYVEPGEFVKLGTNIVKLENPGCLEVVCMLSANNYSLIVPGKTKALFDIDGKPMGEAQVTYRSPSIEPLSRTFKIKIELPSDTPLVSGMLCGVQLVLEERDGKGIPADAVLSRDNGRRIVYLKEGDVARRVEVKAGISDGKVIELLDCEKLAGKEVIVTGQSFVNDGDRVAVIEGGNR